MEQALVSTLQTILIISITCSHCATDGFVGAQRWVVKRRVFRWRKAAARSSHDVAFPLYTKLHEDGAARHDHAVLVIFPHPISIT